MQPQVIVIQQPQHQKHSIVDNHSLIQQQPQQKKQHPMSMIQSYNEMTHGGQSNTQPVVTTPHQPPMAHRPQPPSIMAGSFVKNDSLNEAMASNVSHDSASKAAKEC
jgi:hypothetical protein